MKALTTSEFWIAAAAVAGQVLATLNIVPQDQWNNFLFPAIVYIIGRVTSKAVKPKETK